jgi:DNA polymerase-4
MKTIFHLDMDQFFVAVELRNQPWLRGKPVVVGSFTNNRGIVTTASYEARKYGLRSGMPSIEAARLCPQVIFVAPDFSRYVDASLRIIRILRDYTDRVEPLSIDEACLDVTDIAPHWGGVDALAHHIKDRIRNEEHLTATIGAGANRLVAKVASGMQKPDGFTWLPPEKVAEVYENLPIGELRGIGPATERVLRGFGLQTVGELRRFSPDVLRMRFGKWADVLIMAAHGEGDDVVRLPDDRPLEKSMGHEHTLRRGLKAGPELHGELHRLCSKTARRLRAAELAGRVVTLKLRYSSFATLTHACSLSRYIQHEIDIFPAALYLLHQVLDQSQDVRLIGVHLSDLVPVKRIRQQDLFVNTQRNDDLMQTCDEIRDKFGEDAVSFARSMRSNDHRARHSSKQSVYYRPFHSQPFAPK